MDYIHIDARWEVSGFDAMPRWDREPALDAIAEVLRNRIGPDNAYEIKHLWDGTYNKLYSVDVSRNRYVMKITLPVCPQTKTESEVATIHWTRTNTNLPLPSVIAYDSSANNPIGCEWILMTRVEGVPLSTCWRKMSLGSKERIVSTIAEYATHVWDQQFSGIGNLFASPQSAPKKEFQVGKIATMRFFWHRGPDIETERGPFMTTREWTSRRLNLAHEQLRERLNEMKNSPRAQRDLVWRMLHMSGVLSRLWQLRDRLFPSQSGQGTPLSGVEGPGSNPKKRSHTAIDMDSWEPLRPKLIDHVHHDQNAGPEPTMLWHSNLSADNIMVDPDTGLLNGIVDWEDVSCIPVPVACDWPAFIQEGKNRTTEPEVRDYVKWVPDDPLEELQNQQEDHPADQKGDQKWGKSTGKEPKKRKLSHTALPAAGPKGRMALKRTYWRARRESELTHLRLLFTQEMQTRCPGWYAMWKQSVAHRDFEAAVQHCDNEFVIGRVEAWCAAVEAALDDGAPVRPPAVPSLAAALTQGPDWAEWDDLDDLSLAWLRRAADRARAHDAWLADVARFEDARAAVRAGPRRVRAAEARLQAARAARAREDTRRRRAVLTPACGVTHAERRDVGRRMRAACDAVRDAEERLAAAQARLEMAREHVAKVRAPRPRDKEAWAALEKAAVAAYGENRWWVPKSRKRKKTSKKKGTSVLWVEGEQDEEKGEEEESQGSRTEEDSEVSEEE